MRLGYGTTGGFGATAALILLVALCRSGGSRRFRADQRPNFARKNAIVRGQAAVAAARFASEFSCPRRTPCPAPSKIRYSYDLPRRLMVESVAGIVAFILASLPPKGPSTGADVRHLRRHLPDRRAPGVRRSHRPR